MARPEMNAMHSTFMFIARTTIFQDSYGLIKMKTKIHKPAYQRQKRPSCF